MLRLRLLGLLGALPATAAAQGSVRGVVYDSLLRAPLGGAQVWIHGSSDEHRVVTGPDGGFQFTGLPAGRHGLVVAHPGLDSAGFYNLMGAVAVADGDTSVVTLATPSHATLWQRCGGGHVASPDSGIVYGIVQDVSTGTLLGGAAVIASWFDITRPSRVTVGLEDREVPVRTDAVGRYYACGVATDMIVAVRAYAGRDSTGAIDVTPRARPVTRQDLKLALASGTGAGRARAVLRGTVRDTAGTLLGGARVRVREGGTSVTSVDGVFRLSGLPSGTQWITVHAIGRGPLAQAIDLRPGDSVTVSLTVGPLPVTLDPVLVMRSRSRAMVGVEERRRSALGHVRTANELARIGTMRAVFSTVPSVRVQRVGSSLDFTVLLPNPGVGGRAYCVAPLFIDGARAEYDELRAYRPSDLLAVEVYPRPAGVPLRFQDVSSGCGVVLVWTKYAG